MEPNRDNIGGLGGEVHLTGRGVRQSMRLLEEALQRNADVDPRVVKAIQDRATAIMDDASASRRERLRAASLLLVLHVKAGDMAISAERLALDRDKLGIEADSTVETLKLPEGGPWDAAGTYEDDDGTVQREGDDED